MNHADILGKMTTKEKIALCSGEDFWGTVPYDHLGIPKMIVADGPHGIRMQKGSQDPSELYNCYPATCFPTASAAACTWNKDLLQEMGNALAEEAKALGCDLILGPGVNIKRNPLCGRNFEYYSEDPYLAGHLAAACIRGIQNMGVGACAKHFMGNNQETDRLICDDIMDPRALREIYLRVFEIIIEESNPASMMASYNMVNGVSMTNHREMIKDILRKKWGYEGILMSDWGAISSRVESLKAGVDLEMPGSHDFYMESVEKALATGELSMKDLDAAVDRMIGVIYQYTREKKGQQAFDQEAHDELAKKIATEAGVLLKNQGILPISNREKVALIGGMADLIRYQGSGSSHITPTKVTSILDAFTQNNENFRYYQGYEKQDVFSQELLNEAVKGAAEADKVILVVGLSDEFESEGYDRKTMEIPQSHVELIQRVAKVNPKVVVVMLGGAPVTMDWEDHAQGILNMYLGGQAVGGATYDLLYGNANPSGCLPESYPFSYQDVVSSHTFAKEPRQAYYDESIYVGYRYYQKANVPVRYPFGYGLSYTEFAWTDLKVQGTGYEYQAEVTVTNTGSRAGAVTTQLYLADRTGFGHRPVRELCGFEKVMLEPGESKVVSFKLNQRSFAIYQASTDSFQVFQGTYALQIGASSQNIVLEKTLSMDGIQPECSGIPAWYLNPKGYPDRESFFQLLGRRIPAYGYPKRGSFTTMTPLCDMQASWMVRIITKILMKKVARQFRGNPDPSALRMEVEQLMTAPLQALYLQGHLMVPFWRIKVLVRLGNGLYQKNRTKEN